jgi:triosephosphate isomerase
VASARRPLMAGNWKMHLNHLEALAHVQKLAFSLQDDDFDALDVAVVPPFTDLRSVQTLVDGDDLRLTYGAQDLSAHDSGAYTGEVSGAMLARLGCTYALVGHSERRQHHGETDIVCRDKVRAAYRNGLTPILCVGEDQDTRRAHAHVRHTLLQLEIGIQELAPEHARSLVVAYEPVWAIGTGETASPADAQQMAQAVRTLMIDLYDDEVAQSVRILYGGSIKANNVAEIMAQPDVDGGLVGGASLDPDEFVAICRYRQQ